MDWRAGAVVWNSMTVAVPRKSRYGMVVAVVALVESVGCQNDTLKGRGIEVHKNSLSWM